jgi:hypothetical protein
MLRAFIFFVASAVAGAAQFDPRRDGFAFANETSLAYGTDEAGRLTMAGKLSPPPFTHRCLCMVRGALQFWKFARFEPHAPRLTAARYRERVRKVFRMQSWMPARPGKLRLVIPGYANLWEFSKAHRRMVQEEIGAGWVTYIRPGNWRMACPVTRFFQGATARAAARSLPEALFLTKWPSMNHAVLAYRADRLPDGRMRFHVYDPNYPGETARLDYVPARALFDFERRFYWPGGEVRAFRIYLSPIH